MKRSFAAVTLALLPALALQAPPRAAAAADAPEITLGGYQALSEQERTLYVAGLSDMLDAAAVLAPNNTHLPVIATCTHGYTAADLRMAVEAGAEHIKMKWAETAPAAGWFLTTMIHVCQLQLPPPGQ
jgi:hypothetical protein